MDLPFILSLPYPLSEAPVQIQQVLVLFTLDQNRSSIDNLDLPFTLAVQDREQYFGLNVSFSQYKQCFNSFILIIITSHKRKVKRRLDTKTKLMYS